MKNSKFCLIYPLIGIGVLSVDQIIKFLIRQLPLYASVFHEPGLVEIVHYKNTGAAFSMFRGHSDLLAMISFVLIIALLCLLFRCMHLTRIARICIAILVGSSIGNFIDRIVFGGVTDYIRLLFIRFPVFNFADICITGSIFLLSILIASGRMDKHPEETTHG